MGLSIRIFLLDENDDLYRLPIRAFERMLAGSKEHRFPRFAGCRIRQCGVVVELVDRQPIGVVWTTFSILAFDGDGRFDPSAFASHQRARAEVALAHLAPEPDPAATVIDASAKFMDHGGRWKPTRKLELLIEQAALGQSKCLRLKQS